MQKFHSWTYPLNEMSSRKLWCLWSYGLGCVLQDYHNLHTKTRWSLIIFNTVLHYLLGCGWYFLTNFIFAVLVAYFSLFVPLWFFSTLTSKMPKNHILQLYCEFLKKSHFWLPSLEQIHVARHEWGDNWGFLGIARVFVRNSLFKHRFL